MPDHDHSRSRAQRPLLLAAALSASLAGVGLAVPTDVGAQETITSDRPGIGSGSGVVAPGVFQVESGLGLGGGGASTSLSVGQALVRFGIWGSELEFFGNSYVLDVDGSGGDDEGLQAAGLGAKVPVLRADAVSLSVQGLAVLPSGSLSQRSDRWVFGLNALADFPVSERVAVNSNVGVLAGEGGKPLWSANVTPSYAFDGGVSGYAGWAGTFASGDDVNFAEAGLAFLAHRNLQFDLNGGWSPDTDVWFLGGGVAIRWGAGPR